MMWQFWKKVSTVGEASKAKREKLPGPKDLPFPVGRDLVVKLGKDPDWVWSLRCVARPRPEEKKTYYFRVFDGAEAASNRVKVRDYTSFDDHPELILFEGWFDKKAMTSHIETKEKPTPVRKAA
jgi:hypothetical protein